MYIAEDIKYPNYMYFELWDFHEPWIRINVIESRLLVRYGVSGTSRTEPNVAWYTDETSDSVFLDLLSSIEAIGIFGWEDDYTEGALDGYSWEIQFSCANRYYFGRGSNAKPDSFSELQDATNFFLTATRCEGLSAFMMSRKISKA